MGINIECESKTFVINIKEDGTIDNENGIVSAVVESMTPFLKRYIHDLIEDMDFSCGERTLAVTVSYVTYNNGHFVDPKVHGGPIMLSINDSEEE